MAPIDTFMAGKFAAQIVRRDPPALRVGRAMPPAVYPIAFSSYAMAVLIWRARSYSRSIGLNSDA